MSAARKAKTWKGNSRMKIVGIVPDANSGRKRWNENQQVAVFWTTELHFLLTLIAFLVMRLAALSIQFRMERETNLWLREQLARYNRKKYGQGSAQSSYMGEQIVMQEFIDYYMNHPESENGQDESEDEETIIVSPHKRKRRSRGMNLVNLLKGGFAEEVVDHFPENMTCPECQQEMQKIGVCDERRTLVIVPATIKVRVDRTYSYACKHCDTNSTSAHVVTGHMPPALLPGSFVSPEAVAYVAVQKFLMGAPIYRIEKSWQMQGIPLARMTMNNWLLETSERLKPYMERVDYWIRKETVLLGDETPLKFKSEEPHHAMNTGYVWLVCSSRFSEHQLAHFRFHEDRKHEHHKEYIQGFTGFFQSDGYGAYHDIPGIISVGCMSHARDKFVDARKDGSGSLKHLAQEGITFYDKIAFLENQYKDLPPKQRLAKRKRFVEPQLKALKAWLDTNQATVLPKSLIGVAITYSLNQWDYLYNIMLDGRLDATNNRSERLIKDYVLARKNFLFVMHDKGGIATGTYASLIAISKLNSLDPYKYITWILEHLPQMDSAQPESYDAIMPWCAPDDIKIPELLTDISHDKPDDLPDQNAG